MKNPGIKDQVFDVKIKVKNALGGKEKQ